VLPHPENKPTVRSQVATDPCVSSPIVGGLPRPIFCVVGRGPVVLGANVPEAAIQEDGNLLHRVGEIDFEPAVVTLGRRGCSLKRPAK
jgi:hypothetical protein